MWLSESLTSPGTPVGGPGRPQRRLQAFVTDPTTFNGFLLKKKTSLYRLMGPRSRLTPIIKSVTPFSETFYVSNLQKTPCELQPSSLWVMAHNVCSV